VGAISQCGERKRSSADWYESGNSLPDPLGVSCDGEKTWGSNYGTALDIVAPGVHIVTTTIQSNGDYTAVSGTSAACPHVAGVAALVLSANSSLSGPEVRNIIERTARKINSYSASNPSGYMYTDNPSVRPNGTWNEETGYGLVNAYTAVQVATCIDTLTYENIPFPNTDSVFGCDTLIIRDIIIDRGNPLLITAGKTVIIESDFKIEYGSTVTISTGNP